MLLVFAISCNFPSSSIMCESLASLGAHRLLHRSRPHLGKTRRFPQFFAGNVLTFHCKNEGLVGNRRWQGTSVTCIPKGSGTQVCTSHAPENALNYIYRNRFWKTDVFKFLLGSRAFTVYAFKSQSLWHNFGHYPPSMCLPIWIAKSNLSGLFLFQSLDVFPTSANAVYFVKFFFILLWSPSLPWWFCPHSGPQGPAGKT